METSKISTDMKVISIAFVTLLTLSIAAFLFVFALPSDTSNKSASSGVSSKDKDLIETTETTGLTTTSLPVASTSSSTTTTTSTKPNSTTTVAVQAGAVQGVTTTSQAFKVTSSANKQQDQPIQCSVMTVTFEGTLSANKAGSATWTWIRSDGQATGSSGQVSFNENGIASSSVANYELTFDTNSTHSGWVALKVTYDSSETISSHANYLYEEPNGQTASPSVC